MWGAGVGCECGVWGASVGCGVRVWGVGCKCRVGAVTCVNITYM